MTEAKRHVIDGVTYEEVERNAKVGEKIITVKYYGDSTINNGDIFTVEEANYDDGSVGSFPRSFFDTEKGDEYRVLVPITSPKRHEIDGVLYEEVERKAEIGEKIVIVSSYECPDTDGKIGVVDGFPFNDDNLYVKIPSREYGEYTFIDDNNDEYHVLVPVKNAPESDADIIASLIRRVFVLETKAKKDGELLTEAFTEMLRRRDERIDELSASLDEVYSRLGHVEQDVVDTGKEVSELHKNVGGVYLRLWNNDSRIEKIDETTEMLTDDVVTLDERTQSLVPQPFDPELERIKAEIMEVLR